MATSDIVNNPPLPSSSYLTGTSGVSMSSSSPVPGLPSGLPSLPSLSSYTTGVTSALDVTNPNSIYASQGGVNGMTTSQVAANTLAAAAQGNSASGFFQTFLTWLKESTLPVMLVVVGFFLVIFSLWAIFDRSTTVKTVSKFAGVVAG